MQRHEIYDAVCEGQSLRLLALLQSDPSLEAVNFPDSSGRTPLHYACKHGELYMVDILIPAGADVNCKDVYQQTPLMYAVQAANVTIVKSLIGAGADVTARNSRGFTCFGFFKTHDYSIWAESGTYSHDGLRIMEVLRYALTIDILKSMIVVSPKIERELLLRELKYLILQQEAA